MAKNNFVVVGLPRTGTTLLVDKLNSHSDVFCDNELFNPHQIARYGQNQTDMEGIFYRNSNPVRFWDEFYNSEFSRGHEAIGFNYMLGHNVSVLDKILKDASTTILYVYRENRLAQYASFKKAMRDHDWGTRDKQYNPDKAWQKSKIKFVVGEFEEWCQTVNCLCYMFEDLAVRLSRKTLHLEYRSIASGTIDEEVCASLGVTPRELKGGLVKQGTSSIIDRFENTQAVKNYLAAIGKKHWSGVEL